MENALLIGLSRQMALGHELDIIANNIANIDTTGFKADKTVFSEFLMPHASDQKFHGSDRRLSFVQDRATYIDFSPGSIQRTGNPLDVAIDGKAYLVVQTARGQRYTRNGALSDQRRRPARHQRTATRCWAPAARSRSRTTDHDINISRDGIITVREGSSTADTHAASCSWPSFANPQVLQKDGGSTFMAPPDVASNPPSPNTRVVQGAIEKSNVNGVAEMARMIEITRSYTDIANILSQEGDLRKNALHATVAAADQLALRGFEGT